MKWRTRRLLDNVWGPTGTIVLHVVAVIVLLRLTVMGGRTAAPGVEVVVREIESFEELDDIEEELDELEDIPTVVDAVAPPTVSIDQAPPPVDTVAPSTSGDAGTDEFDVMEQVSPLTFRGLYASRSAAGRGKALAEFAGGMGERTEYAVLKALKWLRDHQEPDGSWGPYYRVSMTSLSLLAFFAHGETTSSEEFGGAIRRGLKFLLKTQKNGLFVGGGPNHFQPQVQVYEHAIGTYAISEAYGLTTIPFLKPAMEDAVQVVIDGQHAAGSWDYGYKLGADAHVDVSLAGWHIQALKAAVAAGAENRGLKAALENGMRGMKARYQQDSGMFKYSTRQESHAPDRIMTGVAVLSMQLAGHALDPEPRGGMGVLDKMAFLWTPLAGVDRGVGEWPFYAWYYITQARFHQGGKTWITWNKQFASTLCVMQNDDGTWCPPPNNAETQFGPVYSTALSALMLEVYYRFLPTYKPIEVERQAVVDEGKQDDIVISFEE